MLYSKRIRCGDILFHQQRGGADGKHLLGCAGGAVHRPFLRFQLFARERRQRAAHRERQPPVREARKADALPRGRPVADDPARADIFQQRELVRRREQDAAARFRRGGAPVRCDEQQGAFFLRGRKQAARAFVRQRTQQRIKPPVRFQNDRCTDENDLLNRAEALFALAYPALAG